MLYGSQALDNDKEFGPKLYDGDYLGKDTRYAKSCSECAYGWQDKQACANPQGLCSYGIAEGRVNDKSLVMTGL